MFDIRNRDETGEVLAERVISEKSRVVFLKGLHWPALLWLSNA